MTIPDTKFCHTFKISNDYLSFTYIPPRTHMSLDQVKREFRLAIDLKSTFIGDTNFRVQSVKNGFNQDDSQFQNLMENNSYKILNNPIDSSMLSSSNILEQI
eukprot:NODE_250_length_11764_cov_1.155594.p10 type:complete len:102 gc:universal NODE_250_length_11764_cov_1.155594:2488-2183(-)